MAPVLCLSSSCISGCYGEEIQGKMVLQEFMIIFFVGYLMLQA
jgi:hypothetical protein